MKHEENRIECDELQTHSSDTEDTNAADECVPGTENPDGKEKNKEKIEKREKKAKKVKKEKKKMKRWKKVLLIIAAVILSLLLILVGVLYGLFKYYYGLLEYEELFSEDKTWDSSGIDEDDDYEDLIDDSVDSSLIATDEEKDKFIGQIEGIGNADRNPSGDFNVEIQEIGGTLGKIERSYVCDYISERDDVINILLIGVDSRKNSTSGSSDTMLVVSICPSAKKIVLTSFLRDVYVMIPGYGGNRLNIAYAAGGPSLLVETIEKNFGLRIDRYATTNFNAFVDVVDSIGTLKMYLTEAELKVINDHIYWTYGTIYKVYDRTKFAIENKGAGYYELNGVQALAYARIRKVGSDFGRTERQRKVLTEVFAQVKKMSPGEWNTLLNKILPKVKTNLTEGDILKMMLNIGAYMKYDITSISTPPRDRFKYMEINGKDVIGVDLDYIREYLYENIYGK